MTDTNNDFNKIIIFPVEKPFGTTNDNINGYIFKVNNYQIIIDEIFKVNNIDTITNLFTFNINKIGDKYTIPLLKDFINNSLELQKSKKYNYENYKQYIISFILPFCDYIKKKYEDIDDDTDDDE
jgi:hypothetical protein